jgi:hypothetical protein
LLAILGVASLVNREQRQRMIVVDEDKKASKSKKQPKKHDKKKNSLIVGAWCRLIDSQQQKKVFCTTPLLPIEIYPFLSTTCILDHVSCC